MHSAGRVRLSCSNAGGSRRQCPWRSKAPRSTARSISEYLTFYYGEEWSEVPGNIAPAKHNTAASMDFSYKDALEYFHPTFNQKELLRETEERRYLVLQHAPRIIAKRTR